VHEPEYPGIGPASPPEPRTGEGGGEGASGPGWRDRAISYICHNRGAVFDRVALLSSGNTRLWELRDGQHTDITDDTVLKLQVDLASMDRLLTDAGIDPELDGDWPARLAAD